MLYRVDISNFRTHKRTTIGPFHNLSAIVGPNGSGKSNIVAALEYVLNSRSVLCSSYVRWAIHSRIEFLHDYFQKKDSTHLFQKSSTTQDQNIVNASKNVHIEDSESDLILNTNFESEMSHISHRNETHAASDILDGYGKSNFSTCDFDMFVNPNQVFQNIQTAETNNPRVVIILTSDLLIESLGQYDDLLVTEMIEYFRENFAALFKDMKKDVTVKKALDAIAAQSFEFTSKNTSVHSINGKLIRNNTVSNSSALLNNVNSIQSAHGIVSEAERGDFHSYVKNYIEKTLSQLNADLQLKRFSSNFGLKELVSLVSIHPYTIIERKNHDFAINGIIFPQILFSTALLLLNLDCAIFPLLNPSSYNSKNLRSLITEELSILLSTCKKHDLARNSIEPENISTNESVPLLADAVDYIPQLSLMTSKHVLSLIQNISLTNLLLGKMNENQQKCQKYLKQIKNLNEKRRRVVVIDKEIKENKDMAKKHKNLLSQLSKNEISYFISLIHSKFTVCKEFEEEMRKNSKSIKGFVDESFSKYFLANISHNQLCVVFKEKNITIDVSEYFKGSFFDGDFSSKKLSEIIRYFSEECEPASFLKNICQNSIQLLKSAIFSIQHRILTYEHQLSQIQQQLRNLDGKSARFEENISIFQENVVSILNTKLKIDDNFSKIKNLLVDMREFALIVDNSSRRSNLSLHSLLKQKDDFDSHRMKNGLFSDTSNGQTLRDGFDSQKIKNESFSDRSNKQAHCFCCEGAKCLPKNDVVIFHKNTQPDLIFKESLYQIFAEAGEHSRELEDQLENLKNDLRANQNNCKSAKEKMSDLESNIQGSYGRMKHQSISDFEKQIFDLQSKIFESFDLFPKTDLESKDPLSNTPRHNLDSVNPCQSNAPNQSTDPFFHGALYPKNPSQIQSLYSFKECCDLSSFFAFIYSNTIDSLLCLKQHSKDVKRNLSDLDIITFMKSKFDLVGRISDLFRINQSKFEIPLSVLIPNLNLIVAHDEKSVFQCVKYLKESKKGRFAFLPLTNVRKSFDYIDLMPFLDSYKKSKFHTQNSNRESKNSEKPSKTKLNPLQGDADSIDLEREFICYAIDTINYDLCVKKAMEYVLEDSIVVRSFDFARYLKYEMKCSQKIVTLDGTLFHKNGFITTGRPLNKFSGAKCSKNDLAIELVEDFMHILDFFKRQEILRKQSVPDFFDTTNAPGTIKSQKSCLSTDSDEIIDFDITKSVLLNVCGKIDTFIPKNKSRSTESFLERLFKSEFFRKETVLFAIFYIFQKYSDIILKNAEKMLLCVFEKYRHGIVSCLVLFSLILNSPHTIIQSLSKDTFLYFTKNLSLSNSQLFEQTKFHDKSFLSFIENFYEKKLVCQGNIICLLPNSSQDDQILNLMTFKQIVSDIINSIKVKKEIFSETESKVQSSIDILFAIKTLREKITIAQSENTKLSNSISELKSRKKKLASEIQRTDEQVDKIKSEIYSMLKLVYEVKLPYLKSFLDNYKLTFCQAEFLHEFFKCEKDSIDFEDSKYTARVRIFKDKIYLYSAENDIYYSQIQKTMNLIFMKIPKSQKMKTNDTQTSELHGEKSNEYENLLNITDFQEVDWKNEDFYILPSFCQEEDLDSSEEEIFLKSFGFIYYEITKYMKSIFENKSFIEKIRTDPHIINSEHQSIETHSIDHDALFLAVNQCKTFFTNNTNSQKQALVENNTQILKTLNDCQKSFSEEKASFMTIKTALDAVCAQINSYNGEASRLEALYSVHLADLGTILNETKLKGIKIPFDFESNTDCMNDLQENHIPNIVHSSNAKVNLDVSKLDYSRFDSADQMNHSQKQHLIACLETFFTKYNGEILKPETYQQEMENIHAELEQIVIKEPFQKKSNIEKIDSEIIATKELLKASQNNLQKYQSTMCARFYAVFNVLNSLISEIYRFIYESDQVGIKLVLQNRVHDEFDNFSLASHVHQQQDRSLLFETLPNASQNSRNMSLENNLTSMHPIKRSKNLIKIQPLIDGFDKTCLSNELDFSSFQIYAMPPNKRFTLLDNLSGGEQTMVNVAILLAITHVKNLPFTFFDEIDSCLDVENAKRLLQFLQTKHSNIIISHRPSVIAMCEALVGVYKTDESHILTYKLD